MIFAFIVLHPLKDFILTIIFYMITNGKDAVKGTRWPGWPGAGRSRRRHTSLPVGVQAGGLQESAFQVRAFQVRAAQTGAGKIGTFKDGTFQVGPGQVGAAQIRGV